MSVIVSLKPLITVCTSLLAMIPISLSGNKPHRREFWTFLAAIIKFLLVCSMVPTILSGTTLTHEFVRIAPGISLAFKVDSFGLLFALVASSLWIVTSIYSIGYMRGLKEHSQTRFFVFFALSLATTCGVAFSANLFTLYVFYELLSLSTYPLVTHNQDKASRDSGRKYLTYLIGTSVGLVLPAMIYVYSVTGSLEFSSLGVMLGHDFGRALPILIIMFLYGFGKAGLMPLHSWLPGAMVAPTPVSSLLHAVAVVKVGVFSIARVITGIFGINLVTVSGLVPIICYIAGFTVITASLIALYQDNMKRRLAFSTIGQLAYIVMGIGLASELAVIGGMSHIVMHAFGKITLFFCAGAIYVATGEKYISKMVGIGYRMPFTMVAFLVGALSVIGLPPTGGFVSKWYMVLGSIDSGQIPIMVIYLISSLLNACYFLPIVYKAFFCTKEESLFEPKIKEAPLCCLIPPLITATLSIVLFFKSDFVIQFAKLMLS